MRECVHSFCRRCLADVIRHCEEPTVSCPGTGCPGELHEREIRALVSPDEYQRWLARGLAAAESGTRNAFHCRTRDCTGWALCDTEVRRFPCPVCKHTNCIPCQVSLFTYLNNLYYLTSTRTQRLRTGILVRSHSDDKANSQGVILRPYRTVNARAAVSSV